MLMMMSSDSSIWHWVYEQAAQGIHRLDKHRGEVGDLFARSVHAVADYRSSVNLTKLFLGALIGSHIAESQVLGLSTTIYQTNTGQMGHPHSTVLAGGTHAVVFSEHTSSSQIFGALYNSSTKLPVTPDKFSQSKFALFREPVVAPLDNHHLVWVDIERNSVGNHEIHAGIVDAGGNVQVPSWKVFASNYIAEVTVGEIPGGFLFIDYVDDSNQAKAYVYKNDGTKTKSYVTVTVTSGSDLVGPLYLLPFVKQSHYLLAYLRKGSTTKQTPNILYGQELDAQANRIGGELNLGRFPTLTQKTYSIGVNQNAIAVAWIDNSSGSNEVWRRIMDLSGTVTHANQALGAADEGVTIVPYESSFVIGYEKQNQVYALEIDSKGAVTKQQKQISTGSGTHQSIHLTEQMKSVYATWRSTIGSTEAINGLEIFAITPKPTPVPPTPAPPTPTPPTPKPPTPTPPTPAPPTPTPKPPTPAPPTPTPKPPTPAPPTPTPPTPKPPTPAPPTPKPPTPAPPTTKPTTSSTTFMTTSTPHGTMPAGPSGPEYFDWVSIALGISVYCFSYCCCLIFFAYRRMDREPEGLTERSPLFQRVGTNRIGVDTNDETEMQHPESNSVNSLPSQYELEADEDSELGLDHSPPGTPPTDDETVYHTFDTLPPDNLNRDDETVFHTFETLPPDNPKHDDETVFHTFNTISPDDPNLDANPDGSRTMYFDQAMDLSSGTVELLVDNEEGADGSATMYFDQTMEFCSDNQEILEN